MADAHIFVKNAGGNGPEDRWHDDEIYKVSEKVAAQLAAMKKKPEGRDLANWLSDHGGKLDDDGEKPARVSTKSNGTTLSYHYKDGEYLKSEHYRPPGVKNDSNAGAHLFLALITGGTSLLVTPFTGLEGDKVEAGEKSKFTKTTKPEEPATATTQTAKVTKTTTTRPKPKPGG
ncbi:MAG: hypothetical protein ACAH83_17955 [Alphaproteobacteria bacterium]